jgi:NADPH:quinone reductase-like Zn-dependent oxidoreductase
MKAIYFSEHGMKENIIYGEIPKPEITANEVLIQTKYAALNHLDLFVLKGWPGLNLHLPHIMGSDGSGIVSEVGENVHTIKVGDRVTVNPGTSCGQCGACLAGRQNFCRHFSIIGENGPGSFAEFFKIPVVNVLKVPDEYPLDMAAAAPLTALTAWRMLVTQGQIKPHQTILIQGAGGGVATTAIQIAKMFNAKVITTTSTQEKVENAKAIGADYVFNYKEQPDYSKTIFKEITKKQGLDMVIDSVGTATFSTSLKLLKPGGKIITCGATTGPKTELDIRAIFWKQLQIIGSTMANQQEFREGKISPVIDKKFPLAEGKAAETYLETGEQFGKVVLEI